MATMLRTYNFCRNHVIGIGLLLLLAPVAFGQVTTIGDDTSTPVPGAGHDYIKMLSETVNPANGSVSVRINVPVPNSLGITIPFSFAYDSNGVWYTDDIGGGSAGWMTSGNYLASGGWSYSVPMLTATNASQIQNGGNSSCSYWINYIFQDPTAARHALALSYVPSNQTCDQAPFQPIPVNTGGDDDYTASMSALGLVTAIDADGTQYFLPVGFSQSHYVGANTYTSLATSVTDRNGNQATINDLGNGAFNIIDTAGRTAVSSSGFGSSGNTVTVSGLPGPYTVYWGTASTNFPRPHIYTAFNSGLGCTGVTGMQTTQPVIRQITLPDNVHSYTFNYDSDDPSSYDMPGVGPYGLLSKITYPDGGYVRYVWGISPLAELVTTADAQGTPLGCAYEYDNYAVAKRFVSFDGNTEILEQDFSPSTYWNQGGLTWATKQNTVISKPAGAQSFETSYTYASVWAVTQPNTGTTGFFPPPATGRADRELL
jgi:hypothetical protein